MVSIINIINGIKGPTRGYQICSTSQLLIFGGMSRRENLCIPELLFGLIPFYIISTLTLGNFMRYEGSCIVYRPEWY